MNLLGDERLEDRARIGVDAGRQVLSSRLGILEYGHVHTSSGGGERVEAQPQLSADAPLQSVCWVAAQKD